MRWTLCSEHRPNGLEREFSIHEQNVSTHFVSLSCCLLNGEIVNTFKKLKCEVSTFARTFVNIPCNSRRIIYVLVIFVLILCNNITTVFYLTTLYYFWNAYCTWRFCSRFFPWSIIVFYITSIFIYFI